MKSSMFNPLMAVLIFNLFVFFGADVSAVAKRTASLKKSPYISGNITARSVCKNIMTSCGKSIDKEFLEDFYRISSIRMAEAIDAEMESAVKTLATQPGVLRIDGATAVIGDIHGDYVILKKIIEKLSPKMEKGKIQNVVFLGDYLDRGPSSARTIYILLKFFNQNPGRVFLLRGNHEVPSFYHFGEGLSQARCEKAFKNIDEDLLMSFFDNLPYAAIINGETLAVHGGVPRLDCFKSFWECGKPKEGDKNFQIVYSSLWADYNPRGDARTPNTTRGIDPFIISYNDDCVNLFLCYLNERYGTNLKYMIRSHQPHLGAWFVSPNKALFSIFSSTLDARNYSFYRNPVVALLRPGSAPRLFEYKKTF